MITKKTKYTSIFLCIIFTLFVFILLSIPNDYLRIIACDVGQGDAILIKQRNTQILIDGGPDRSVLNCLSRHMPFWDKKIEAVILTHPDGDHLNGLLGVFESYQVDNFLTTGIYVSSPEYEVLEKMVGSSKSKIVFTDTSQNIRLGLMSLDILHPSKSFIESNKRSNHQSVMGLFETKKSANDFSLVVVLSYKKFDALFTGDIGPKISDVISQNDKLKDFKIEYLKVPHHGSKNGLTENLMEVVNPQVVVISAGKGNRYGHPHKEVLKILRDKDIKTLRTDEVGTIEIISDGEKLWID